MYYSPRNIFSTAPDFLHKSVLYWWRCGTCWYQVGISTLVSAVRRKDRPAWKVVSRVKCLQLTNILHWCVFSTSSGLLSIRVLSAVHDTKRKPHSLMAWGWYHFVSILIYNQPSPYINTRWQLSDTSSVQPLQWCKRQIWSHVHKWYQIRSSYFHLYSMSKSATLMSVFLLYPWHIRKKNMLMYSDALQMARYCSHKFHLSIYHPYVSEIVECGENNISIGNRYDIYIM